MREQNRRTIPVTKEMVEEAYKKVKRGGKTGGVDDKDMLEFNKEKTKNLYKIWNRLSSGSYFPPAVKRVEIAKSGGGKRPLGIPTVGDRVAQMVIKKVIEGRLEKIFHKNSYGYREGKSAIEAVKEVRTGTLQFSWVLDIDIKNFFDSIDHELMMKAIEKHVGEKWVKMYIKRWLEAPTKIGEEIEQKEGKGTVQGGVISPLLSNLYLHYSIDTWLSRNYPEIRFIRYADDLIVFCKTEKEAEEILNKVKMRMKESKLTLHPDKTKKVYTKSWKHKEDNPEVQFDFLGFTFQPRMKRSKYDKTKMYLGYDGAISKKSKKKIMEELRKLKVLRNTEVGLEEISIELNPKLRGWINYYGEIGRYKLRDILKNLDRKLVKWVLKKYRKLKRGVRKGYKMLTKIKSRTPTMLEHWKVGLDSLD